MNAQTSEKMIADVAATITALYEDGSPVAGRPEEMAGISLRRWCSSSYRGVNQSNMKARVDDLTAGLIAHFEKSPKTVGALRKDYEHAAQQIASRMSADSN